MKTISKVPISKFEGERVLWTTIILSRMWNRWCIVRLDNAALCHPAMHDAQHRPRGLLSTEYVLLAVLRTFALLLTDHGANKRIMSLEKMRISNLICVFMWRALMRWKICSGARWVAMFTVTWVYQKHTNVFFFSLKMFAPISPPCPYCATMVRVEIHYF